MLFLGLKSNSELFKHKIWIQNFKYIYVNQCKIMTTFFVFHCSEVSFDKETSNASLEGKDSSCDLPICSYLCLKNPFLDSVSGIMFCTTGKSTAQHKQRDYTLMRFHKIYSKQIFNVMSKVSIQSLFQCKCDWCLSGITQKYQN